MGILLGYDHPKVSTQPRDDLIPPRDHGRLHIKECPKKVQEIHYPMISTVPLEPNYNPNCIWNEL